jgi:hypothetical protein
VFVRRYGVLAVVCAVLTVAIGSGIGYIEWLSYSNGIQVDLRTLSIALVPLIFPFMGYISLATQIQKVFIKQIATALGFTYTESEPVGERHAVMFAEGTAHWMNDILTGTYRDYQMRIYTHSYTVGEGKSRRVISEMMCELDYPQPLPHILLNFKKDIPNDVERVMLEGNFSDLFPLYVSRGKQMEVREIFQPDAMEVLANSFTKNAIEITAEPHSATVYISYPDVLDNRAQFLQSIALVDNLIDRILSGLGAVGRDKTSYLPNN